MDWLIEIADRDWIGFCEDAAIKRNEAERETAIARGARLFVVPRADVRAAEVAARFITNLGAITTPIPACSSTASN